MAYPGNLVLPNSFTSVPILVDDALYNRSSFSQSVTGSYDEVCEGLAAALGISSMYFKALMTGGGYLPSYKSKVINNDGTVGNELYTYFYPSNSLYQQKATTFYIEHSEPGREDKYPVNPTQSTTDSSWNSLGELPSGGYHANALIHCNATYSPSSSSIYENMTISDTVCIGTIPNQRRLASFHRTAERSVVNGEVRYDIEFDYNSNILVMRKSDFSSTGDIITPSGYPKAISLSMTRDGAQGNIRGSMSFGNGSGDNVTYNMLVGSHVEYVADPLSGGGYSSGAIGGEPGSQYDVGGNGIFTLNDDDIPRSDLPSASLSIIGAGSGLLYVDSGANINALMRYMWTHADDIVANLKKIIANPIDAILGLHIVPVIPSYGTAQEVYLGNVGTNVMMNPVTNPYVRFVLGSVVIPKYWGSALDHNPFSEVSIFLPYIGFRRLNVDELMGATCTLYYDVDVASGACVAHLEVTRTDAITGKSTTSDAYNWAGNCAMQIPVTSNNYQGLYSSIYSGVMSIAMGIASGGIGGMTSGTIAGQAGAGLSIAQGFASAANNLYGGGSKIRVDKEGNISGAHGFLGTQYAFIERTTPRQSLASTYKKVLGYPSNISMRLGNCEGFTQVEDINLEAFTCTADEKNELESLLKGGVIF